MFRFLFILIIMLVSSCKKTECEKLVFDKQTKTTYLNSRPFSGQCKSFYINGSLKSIQNYRNGLDDGEWIFYYLNGNTQTKGSFNSGIRIGKWRFYHENGKIWKEHNYDNEGNKTGNWKTFSQNGELIEDLKY